MQISNLMTFTILDLEKKLSANFLLFCFKMSHESLDFCLFSFLPFLDAIILIFKVHYEIYIMFLFV